MSFFCMCATLSVVEEAYIEACVEEIMNTPNPFKKPMTILDFLREGSQPTTCQPQYESIMDEEKFTLNNYETTYS